MAGAMYHAALRDSKRCGWVLSTYRAPVFVEGCPGERQLRFAFPDGGPSDLASRANVFLIADFAAGRKGNDG